MREDRAMSPGRAAPDPIRIVVADDDPLFARRLRAQASAHPSLEVVGIATNGREAVELNDELVPDVVLMDAGMQGLDGVEAAETIRDRSDPPTLVLVTGDAPDARVYKAGAAAYVRKPADLIGLMDIVFALSQLAFS
jgi:DNA-binding NarL/FixJ family response regulator